MAMSFQRRRLAEFDRLAEDGGYSGSHADDRRKRILKLLDLTKDEVVCDAGCGNGTMLPTDLDAVRVDFSRKTLEVARRNVRSGDFVCASIDHMPFRDKVFDKVLCYSLMLLVRDYRSTERELRRVTRKRLLIGDCRMFRFPRSLSGVLAYARKVKESVQTGTWVRWGLRPGDFSGEAYMNPEGYSFDVVEELANSQP